MNFVKQAVTRAMRGHLSKLDRLYQRHSGEECYLFGAGVSLKWMDLHQFADRPSILGNMTIYHKEVDALNVPYSTIIKPLFFYPVIPRKDRNGKSYLDRNHLHEEFRKTIRQRSKTLFFINVSNYPVARFSNALYVTRWYKPPFDLRNPFRERLDSHQGTFKFQLALAIYLGFKRAYLLGHDYTHHPSRSLHFYEKGEGVLDSGRGFSREYIDYAKRYIDLITVTVDGGSETMESVTYKQLTGKDPKFRENVEIVDRVKLENMATRKRHTVF